MSGACSGRWDEPHDEPGSRASAGGAGERCGRGRRRGGAASSASVPGADGVGTGTLELGRVGGGGCGGGAGGMTPSGYVAATALAVAANSRPPDASGDREPAADQRPALQPRPSRRRLPPPATASAWPPSTAAPSLRDVAAAGVPRATPSGGGQAVHDRPNDPCPWERHTCRLARRRVRVGMARRRDLAYPALEDRSTALKRSFGQLARRDKRAESTAHGSPTR